MRCHDHIRDRRQTLDQLLCRVGCLNTTMMSLLRGSFDVVLPCIATNSGGCSGESLRASRFEAYSFVGWSHACTIINIVVKLPIQAKNNSF